MKHYLIISKTLLLLLLFWSCKKEEDIDEACSSQPLQVFLEYRADTLFAVVPQTAGSISYLWQGGEKTSFIIPNGPGTYTVRATDARECRSANSIKLGCDNGEFTIEDRDGNIYHVVQVGDQCWCAENLKAKFNTRGLPLSNGVEDIGSWKSAASYAELFPGEMNYGLHYNRIAIDDSICPPGWRIPGEDDWNMLFDNLGGQLLAAPPLRSSRGWENGNNASGIGAYPSGFANESAELHDESSGAYFWSAPDKAYHIPDGLDHQVVQLSPGIVKNHGLSVRCMKGVEEAIDITDSGLPNVNSLMPQETDILPFSAKLKGQIVDAAGIAQEWGIILKEQEVQQESLLSTDQVTGDGVFEIAAEQLKQNTDYEFRAFAENEQGTGYGDWVTFTTKSITLNIVDSIAINTIAPDSIEISMVLNIEVEGEIPIGTTYGLRITRLDDESYQEITNGNGEINAAFSVVPKKEYEIRAFVEVDGQRVDHAEPETFQTDAVHWSDDPLGQDWAEQDAVLLNEGKLWKTINSVIASGISLNLDSLVELEDDSAYAENTNGEMHGNLYNGFSTVNNPCPEGWEIPTYNEALSLLTWLSEIYDGNQIDIANSIKTPSSMEWSNNGNNESGFDALESGFVLPNGENQPESINPQHIDHSTFWWTRTVEGNQQYWFGIGDNGVINPQKVDRKALGSVRCVRDRY